MSNKQQRKSRSFVMPDAYIIIFSIVILMALATYLVPAGEYERETVDNITKVVPGSYQTIESNPANLLDIFKAVQVGMIESANIIFLIFIIGGIVHVIDSTGAINSGINSLIDRTKGRYMLLIASVAGIFGVLASVGIAANAVIAFIPIGIALARSLKLDAIVGVATIYLGYYSGMIAGIFDPTILGLAQTIAELPLFSGMWLRIIIFFALITITILYTNRYAKKIKEDPSKSLMGERKFATMEDPASISIEDSKFTGKHQLILFTFIAFIAFFIYGAFNMDWGLNELVGLFLMMGVRSEERRVGKECRWGRAATA